MQHVLELGHGLMGLPVLALKLVVLGLQMCAHVIDFDDVLFRLLLYLCDLPLIFGLHDL